jgi:hypothetical protein
LFFLQLEGVFSREKFGAVEWEVPVVKIWDGLMKRLVQANPQDLIAWIFPDAVYEGELNTELQKDPVVADLMYVVRRRGKQVGFHWDMHLLCVGLKKRLISDG